MPYLFLLLALATGAFGSVPGRLQTRRDGHTHEHTHAHTDVQLDVPGSPPQDRQVVDGRFLSYSIEFSYMLDFAGNNSSPNLFSRQLLQNLGDAAGAYPIIRAGGTTQNRNLYIADQAEALKARFSRPGADQPASLSTGPAWFESFRQFPHGTQYIYGLNFLDGPAGKAQAVLQAGAAYRAIGPDLYAFEIGNEVDGWHGGSRRPANYTTLSYVNQWNEYADAIAKEALGGDDNKPQPLFQGCAFEAPRHIDSAQTSIWNVESVLRLGMARSGRLKTVADHAYMGSNRDKSKRRKSNHKKAARRPTIKDNILNHRHMTATMWYHDYLGNFSASQGVPYVLGETNSISAQGTPGVSDVFASALWAVDYVLYVATLKVSRLYFHMGTPYRYSPWQPVTIGDTAPYAKPLYYGNLLAATALSGGNKKVQMVLNETYLTAYAIFDAGHNDTTPPSLTSLVFLNLNMYNSTFTSSRPYKNFDFTLPSTCTGQVHRLTAPGVEVARNVTFAGQYVCNSTGVIAGNRVVEDMEDLGGGKRRVKVGDGEAVLVTIQKKG